MKMNKRWILFSLFNFLMAALMGLVLRGAFVWGSSWDYINVMHAHSHVAMLGWVYMALYILIGYRFIPSEQWEKPVYSQLFWFTQFTVFGMMVSFPLQGYGAFSITFSTLHILASYLFGYRVWKDHRTRHPEISLLIKTALVLMAVSTIGVWTLGPLAMTGGRSSTLYQLAIQFYLHFQFHGWFTFVLLALLLDVLVKNPGSFRTTFKRFYGLLVASVAFTYGLVLAWGLGGPIPLIANGLGLLFQLMALLLFFKMIKEGNPLFFKNLTPSTKAFYRFGLASWIVKVAIQTIVLIPAAALVSFTIRSFMIGFIHLTMLGFISGLLFALILGSSKKAAENKWAYSGRVAFITGFALTELLLFVQGLSYWVQWGQVPAFYESIFGASVLLPVAILLITVGVARHYDFKRIPRVMTT
jgi:hypothetical protein